MRKDEEELWKVVVTLSSRYGVRPRKDVGIWWENLVSVLPMYVVESFITAFEETRDNCQHCRGVARKNIETMLSILYRRRTQCRCI